MKKDETNYHLNTDNYPKYQHFTDDLSINKSYQTDSLSNKDANSKRLQL